MPIQSIISGAERQEWRGDGVADLSGFGIIRKAALYVGHGPGTVKLFMDLWNKK